MTQPIRTGRILMSGGHTPEAVEAAMLTMQQGLLLDALQDRQANNVSRMEGVKLRSKYEPEAKKVRLPDRQWFYEWTRPGTRRERHDKDAHIWPMFSDF